MAKSKDVRMMTVYSGARLVTYDQTFKLTPDMLAGNISRATSPSPCICAKVICGLTVTPFTTEDFRYWWEDVANNEDLQPGGVPRNCWRMASRQSRDHRQPHDPLFMGQREPAVL